MSCAAIAASPLSAGADAGELAQILYVVFALFDGSEVGIPARLSFLKSLRPRFRSVVEVGGNRSDEFAASFRPFTDGYLNCEIAGDAAGDVQSLSSLKDGSANLIVTYYVFEHVAGLPECGESRRVLSDDGILVRGAGHPLLPAQARRHCAA